MSLILLYFVLRLNLCDKPLRNDRKTHQEIYMAPVKSQIVMFQTLSPPSHTHTLPLNTILSQILILWCTNRQ